MSYFRRVKTEKSVHDWKRLGERLDVWRVYKSYIDKLSIYMVCGPCRNSKFQNVKRSNPRRSKSIQPSRRSWCCPQCVFDFWSRHGVWDRTFLLKTCSNDTLYVSRRGQRSACVDPYDVITRRPVDRVRTIHLSYSKWQIEVCVTFGEHFSFSFSVPRFCYRIRNSFLSSDFFRS